MDEECEQGVRRELTIIEMENQKIRGVMSLWLALETWISHSIGSYSGTSGGPKKITVIDGQKISAETSYFG
jgi:predicted ThiF/HesA family dinucleotide-utilizing enzyme